jgi:DNA-binding response OmpR family regulator
VAKKSKSSKRTILIVEDEPGFRQIYRDMFESEGYSVMEADDGEKGLVSAELESVDLVLLDLILPKVGGLDALRKLREHKTKDQLPVIILSVLGDQQSVNTGLDLGANDYVVKGYTDPKDILKKIAATLKPKPKK